MSTTVILPLRELPSPVVAGRFPLDDDAFRTTYHSSSVHALHLHDYHASMRMGPHRFNLVPGDLTLTPATLTSGYALPQPGHHWCIHFLRHRKRIARGQAFEVPLHLPLGPQASFAVERFRRISTLFARTREHNALAAASASLLLQELLLWIADLHRAHPPAQRAPSRIDEALDRLVSILQARFTENLSVPGLAGQLGLSQNYLARSFRQRFHTTIPHYLVARRIEHACYLLASTNMPVRRVGQRVGIPDAQHFNKQFRRIVGQNPTAYRLDSQSRRQG
jgi:AraC-like DNA-binding protein